MRNRTGVPGEEEALAAGVRDAFPVGRTVRPGGQSWRGLEACPTTLSGMPGVCLRVGLVGRISWTQGDCFSEKWQWQAEWKEFLQPRKE